MFNAMLKDINAIPSRFSRILNLFYGLWDWVAIIRCVIKVTSSSVQYYHTLVFTSMYV